jgi:hypothetical protein
MPTSGRRQSALHVVGTALGWYNLDNWKVRPKDDDDSMLALLVQAALSRS